MGDGEINEGSVWEAAACADKHHLANLTAIIDYNKIQSAGSVSAAPVQSEGEPDATTAAAPERDQGPVASRTDGLFVARNVPGGPR